MTKNILILLRCFIIIIHKDHFLLTSKSAVMDQEKFWHLYFVLYFGSLLDVFFHILTAHCIPLAILATFNYNPLSYAFPTC